MDQSPRLSLSYVKPSQAQKHVTVNETFRRLDALTQLTVVSRTVTVQPASPADGDAYILSAGPTGTDWGGYSQNNVAVYQDGAWEEFAAVEGLRAWISDGDTLDVFDGAAWATVVGGSETADKFGVNTTADTTNRLSVKSDAVLFNHDDVTPGNDDILVKVNKKLAADTASVLFQTGASGRAEAGLTGDDDFHIKVSPNGSTWYDAIIVDKDNGRVGINSVPSGFRFSVMGTNGDQFVLDNAGEQFTQFNINNNGSGKIFIALDNTANRLIFGAQGSYSAFDSIAFRPDGSTDDVQVQRDGSFLVGNPTGGGKGAGTINAQGVYDDNTLLSCYVFDQALDGSIDSIKWDKKVPDRKIPEVTIFDETTREPISVIPSTIDSRRHQPMRKFKMRIGSAYDPLTLDGYAKHWREKRHLSSMPNEAKFDPGNDGLTAGEWIQRLVETVEIQAVLIEQLNAKIKSRSPHLPMTIQDRR